MGGMKTIASSETRIEALRLQSSAFGVPVTVGWGLNRVPGNMLWYGGFKAVPHTETQGGKGGGVRVQNTTYTYQASVAMAIGEGQIIQVGKIWRGKKLYEGGYAASQLTTRTHTATVPAGGVVTVPDAASLVASVSVRTGAVLFGAPIFMAPAIEGSDYTRAGGVYTFGSHMVGRSARIVYQTASGAPALTALQQLGMTLFTGTIGQATWSHLTTNFPTQAIGYSGIAYVSAADYDLGSGAQVENHNFEVQWPGAYVVSASAPDADPALFTPELLLNERWGAMLPPDIVGDTDRWSTYCRAANLLMSPALTTQMQAREFLAKVTEMTNTAVVCVDGQIEFVPYGDQELTANGATYVPDLAPVYDLRDDDFLNKEEPVRARRKARADAWNHVRVQFSNRAQQYNIDIAEAKDTAAIDTYGLRTMPTVQAQWVCDAQVARNLAQIILQRAQYVLNEYTTTVPWTRSLLKPMDLVTLTDQRLRLQLTPVRVVEVGESEDGEIELVCEDFPRGIAAATLYPQQQAGGYLHDYNAAPGNVADPVIFEAPGDLASPTGLEVYVAARGTSANWGGCRVWVSIDGTQYREMATIAGGSRFGTVAGPISGGNLSVTLTGGQLTSGSASDAAQLATLCYVGGATPEYLAFQTATLTGTLAYTLSGLVRGAYGTPAAVPHAAGDTFVRIDSAVAKSGSLDRSLIGQAISFKFTSFNIYGAAEQDLADVPAYAYTLVGNLSTRGRVVRGADPITDSNVAVVVQPDALTSVFRDAGSTTFTVTTLISGTGVAQQAVLSRSYTATVDCKAEVYAEAQVTYTNSDAVVPAAYQYSIQDANATLDGWKTREEDIAAGVTRTFAVQTSRTFDLVAGTVYNFIFGAAKFRSGDTASVARHEMRVTIVKR